MTRPKSSNGNYGSRGRLADADAGVRRVAPTFGKVRFLTYSEKAAGPMAVESDFERLVAHMLTLDPRVKKFKAQPFTVDLIDRRLLRTCEAVTEARAKHKSRSGPRFYTPDFEAQWYGSSRSVIEVKLEGYCGDEEYEFALVQGAGVLEANGYGFTTVVIPPNPKHPLRSNLPLLRQAASRHDLWPTPDVVQAIEAVTMGDQVPLGKLCRELGIAPNLIPVLLVSGAVSADVARHAVNGMMPLQAAYGDLSHLELLEGLAR